MITFWPMFFLRRMSHMHSELFWKHSACFPRCAKWKFGLPMLRNFHSTIMPAEWCRCDGFVDFRNISHACPKRNLIVWEMSQLKNYFWTSKPYFSENIKKKHAKDNNKIYSFKGIIWDSWHRARWLMASNNRYGSAISFENWKIDCDQKWKNDV